MDISRQFALKKPCANCPFRNDVQAISLSDGRREQIIEDLLSGKDSAFHCHKTVHRSDGRNFDDNDEYVPKDICQCPGAAAVAQKFGRDVTVVQIAIRLGVISADYYDESLPLTLNAEDLNIDKFKAKI
ncbi:MAG: hypothetical protein QM500_12180 [Methylococcales bacterium]